MKPLVVNLKLFLFLVFLSVVLLLFEAVGLLGYPKSLAQVLTIPVQYGLYKSGMGISSQFGFIFEARKAALENKALKKQLGEILTENSTLRQEVEENKSLVDSYNKLNPKTYDLLPARVLGISRYLKIDKGLDDGVVKDQAVVFKDNYIGRIYEVSPKTAQVLLLTDPDSKLAAFSQGEGGRARGILQGQFGAETLMDKILHQEKLEVNNLVYSEGTEGKLPKGLILGKIVNVNERQNEVFKQAKVEPIFTFTDLDIVFVIRDP